MARGRRRAEVKRSRTPLLLALVATLAIGVTVGATAVVGLDPVAGPLSDVGDEGAPAPGSEAGGGADEGDEDADAAGPADSVTRGGEGERDPAGSAPAPSPGEVDLSGLPVGRVPDCDRLDDEALKEALGAPVALRTRYLSGDRVEVATGVTDVVAENACVFRSPLADARVWAFDAPVDAAYAEDLVRDARRTPGCEEDEDRIGYGDPTFTDVCTTKRPRASTATLRGLFDDTWLTCRLRLEGESEQVALERARRWCVHAATALAADD